MILFFSIRLAHDPRRQYYVSNYRFLLWPNSNDILKYNTRLAAMGYCFSHGSNPLILHFFSRVPFDCVTFRFLSVVAFSNLLVISLKSDSIVLIRRPTSSHRACFSVSRYQCSTIDVCLDLARVRVEISRTLS